MAYHRAPSEEARVHLRFMLPSYPWTRGLELGRVQIPGITYACAPYIENAPDRFAAFVNGQFDVGEDSVRSFIVKRLQGGPANALPVFFDREHMQRNIFVRADSPLQHPRDLVGKHVGTRQTLQSGTCSGVLMMLEQGYSVPLDRIHWHSGNPSDPPRDRLGLDVTRGPASDQENLALLMAGELDAMISNLEGRYWSMFGPDILDHEVPLPAGVRPLISNADTIADTYRRTGLYPITDVVVVRPELLAEYPDLPARLLQAFNDADQLAVDYRSGIEEHFAQLELALLGDNPHVHALTANARHNLTVFIDLLDRLGGIDRSIAVDDLFASSPG
jgi:4,5-dihydroxyphthalate decarboxylase